MGVYNHRPWSRHLHQQLFYLCSKTWVWLARHSPSDVNQVSVGQQRQFVSRTEIVLMLSQLDSFLVHQYCRYCCRGDTKCLLSTWYSCVPVPISFFLVDDGVASLLVVWWTVSSSCLKHLIVMWWSPFPHTYWLCPTRGRRKALSFAHNTVNNNAEM